MDYKTQLVSGYSEAIKTNKPMVCKVKGTIVLSSGNAEHVVFIQHIVMMSPIRYRDKGDPLSQVTLVNGDQILCRQSLNEICNLICQAEP